MPSSDPSLDLLITGARVLTAEPAIPYLEDGVIGITGGKITLVAPASSETKELTAKRRLDATGHIVTPGFVNVHTHAVLSLARGMSEDMGFAPAYTPGVPHVPDIREDEAVALARLTALEAMLFGSTLINDMHVHAHATLPAMAELGLRVSASAWIHDVDFTRVHERVWNYQAGIGERMMRYALDLIDKFQGAFDGRASVMFAPHAVDTCSKRYLSDVEAERRRLGLHVMTHVAQSRFEVAQVRERDGQTPIEMLDDIGMLHDKLIAAHCIFMTEDDIARAGKARITVAHAPKVNLTGGCLPVSSKLRRAGARLALATDNMHGDMVETMRWALVAGRLQEQGVTDFWSSRDVFQMGTLDAARSMGREHDLGSLKVGKQADLVIFDMNRAHLTPSYNPLGTLVHLAHGRDVRTVVVAGRIVVEDGRATMVDEEDILRQGAEATRRLWTRVTGVDPAVQFAPTAR